MVETGKRQAVAGGLPSDPNGKGLPLPPDDPSRHLPLGLLTLLGIRTVRAQACAQVSDLGVLGTHRLCGLGELLAQRGGLPALIVLRAAD